jgi:hypothetical protein
MNAKIEIGDWITAAGTTWQVCRYAFPREARYFLLNFGYFYSP